MVPAFRWFLAVLLMSIWAPAAAPASVEEPAVDCLELGLSLERKEITLHEPVLATLRVINRCAQAGEIDLGRMAEGNLGLMVVAPDGMSEDSRKRFESGLSFPGLVRLKKGEVHWQTVVLNEWYDRFNELGEYSVTIYIGEKTDWPEAPQATATVQITPRDPERLKETCNNLEARAMQADTRVSTKAASALGFVADEVCLPHLERVLKESDHGQEGALRGLARIGTTGAISALVAGWDRLLNGERAIAWGLLDEAQRQLLVAELAKAGKQLKSEDPWN